MYKRIGRVLLPLLFFCLLAVHAEAAEYDGYIIRIDPEVRLLSGDGGLPEGVDEVYAPEGLYHTSETELVRELEEAGRLAYAEPDWIVTLEDVPNDPACSDGLQWELPMLHMDYAWDKGITGVCENGEPVRIGVVDSGVFAAHEDLEGVRLLDGTNYCAEAGSAERSDLSDSVGHGTFITGILAAATGNGRGVAGLAPRAEIAPLKCFTAKTGKMSHVIAAIYGGVDDYHCQILNMSLAVSQAVDGQALSDAVAYAEERGVWIVAAVGNASGGSTGNDPVLYPAGYDTVIGVGAVNREKAAASFSYRNSSVFVTAPGQNLYGLNISAEEPYTTGSGTSYAAPMVSAAAALAPSVRPELTRAEFMDCLRETAEDLGEPGWDASYGCGLLDIGKLLETLENTWSVTGAGDGKQLAVRMTGLSPGSPVLLVQTVRDSGGRQTGVFLTEETAEPDGSLKRVLPLKEPGAGETLCVLALDQDFCPLRAGWSCGGEG